MSQKEWDTDPGVIHAREIQAVARKNELELAVRTAVARLMFGTNGKEDALKILRHAIGA